MPVPQTEVVAAALRFRAGAATLLDVREESEIEIAEVEGALWIPMREVPARLAEIPQDKPVLVICHHGSRSQMVAAWLAARGYRAENVAGGIDAWADEVDDRLAKY
ncbi:MAG: sulfur-carrier protein adenylyltransferase/sulfurtransferase [Thermoplasmata archaeon]|jgi:adenylyltransferase/sulfurtransferase|nr:sulfur-carrier protein adenylyltransferase/sulfurtransferase [Thermoplasmata archaeon]